MPIIKKNRSPSKINYVLQGDPIPLSRVRIGNRRCWDPQKELKLISSITIQQQHGDNPKFHGPLHMDVTFYFHIPKTHMKHLHPGTPHAFKPDLDNLVKLICDICQNVIFANDCCIAEIYCKKVYDDIPRTEFTVYQLETK